MDDHVTLTDEDEGKKVVNANGDEVGRVVSVDHGTAHVDPDPDITDTVRSKLGWGEADRDTYELDSANIQSVSDDEIHLDR